MVDEELLNHLYGLYTRLGNLRQQNDQLRRHLTTTGRRIRALNEAIDELHDMAKYQARDLASTARKAL